MSRCKSCAAEIVWAVTTGGKRIPVDAHPAPGGNLVLRQTIGGPPRALMVGATIDMTDPDDDGQRWWPHHGTCPQASEWRAKR